MKKTLLRLGILAVAVVLFTNFTDCIKKKDTPVVLVGAELGTGINIGDVAPEIEMKNPDGEIMKLSDLRGKVVLIDFWASWCGPCRRENPNVVATYKKYNKAKFKKSPFKVEHRTPSGFEVFSVSLDGNTDRWKAAIEKDGLTWDTHVSDLKKWSNAAAAKYGVRSIPAAFLIDANGIIIAKGQDLRGPGLEANLKALAK